MPFDGKTLCCPNHPDTPPLVRDERMFDLLAAGRSRLAGSQAPPDTGGSNIASAWIVVYSCPTCGYVELYMPEQLQEWQSATT